MNLERVSVIVPVYNGEHVIRDCLNSIVRQTYSKLEIICVDDGSSDGTLAILEQYSNTDHRVRVFTKRNGGVGSARNLGLSEATGTYIVFVDADDWIDEDSIAQLLESFDGRSQFVIGLRNVKSFTIGLDRIRQFVYWGLRTEAINSPTNRVFQRKIIKEIGLRFPEFTSIGEDLIFNLRYVLAIENLKVVKNASYNVGHIQGSITRSYRATKYEELIRTNDCLRSLLEPFADDEFRSLLNFLKFIALISAVTTLRMDITQRSKASVFLEIQGMQNEAGPLPVLEGDVIMKVIGRLYALLGLRRSAEIVRLFQCVRLVLNKIKAVSVETVKCRPER